MRLGNQPRRCGLLAGQEKRKHRVRAALLHSLLVGMLTLAGTAAQGGAREQAKRMHERLTGVPPTDTVLDQMATLIPGDPVQAAMLAIQNSAFYSVTLKSFATPWTNRDQTVFAPLNDYTATVIGMVRDDVPFNQVLSADMVYVGSGISPAYSTANNDHYQAMEDQNSDLKAVLVQRTQSSLNGLPPSAVAGVITSRAAAQAFFIAGTNRAMFRFTLLNHLCRDMEQLQDTSRPSDRIRQDVSRSPGGDSRIFLNNCVGCHSGMDPMAQAFAYYNFDETSGQIVYTDGQVQPKYHINADNFRPGYVTPDDHWDNRWRKGHNQLLGWATSGPGSAGSGTGAKSLGEELANSGAFAQCQVEKVFRNVCFRAPSDLADRTEVGRIVGVFKANGYSLKRVFAETAVYCMGQ